MAQPIEVPDEPGDISRAERRRGVTEKFVESLSTGLEEGAALYDAHIIRVAVFQRVIKIQLIQFWGNLRTADEVFVKESFRRVGETELQKTPSST